MTPNDHDPNLSPTTGPIRLSDTPHLIAATPYLLGFFPSESLVMHVLDGMALTVSVRMTLPGPIRYRSMAEHAAALVRDRDATGTVALIVSASRHPTLASHIRAEFDAAGLHVQTLGLPEIAEGTQWFSYGPDREHGTTPDPTASPLALDSVLRGLPTYPSRDDLAATLAPDPAPVLARRAALIEAQRPTWTAAHETTQSRFQHLRHEVERTAHRSAPLTDQDIGQLALALEDHHARDRCLSLIDGTQAAAAERLWSELTRSTPAPYRAEPAVLLAMSAYIRGDGALAVIALDRAQHARPDHTLAALLRRAVHQGMRPDELADVIDVSRAWAN